MINWIKQLFAKHPPVPAASTIDAELEARKAAEFEGVQIAPVFGPWNIPDGLEMYGLPRIMPGHIEDAIAEEAKIGGGKVTKAWATLVEATPPFQAQFASPYAQGTPVFELGSVNPLFEWNWQTRRYVLEQCHVAYERNPLAAAIVDYFVTFSVQNGFNLTTQNKDVADLLNAFIDNPYNAVRELDKSLVASLKIDGEIFIRFFEGGGDEGGERGETVIVPLRPWGVQWIHANPDNWRDVIEYRYSTSISDGSGLGWKVYNEDIPAEQVLHVAINRLPYEQRGRPDLFKILPYLSAYKRWLEDRARQNAFRGGVLDVTLSNGNPGQVAAKIASYKKPAMAGSVFVHNDNEVIQVLQQLVGASDAAEDGRRLLLMIAAGARLPEYFLADGANANLASTTSQALPAMRAFADVQDIMINQVWKPVFKRVIQSAVDAGLIPEMVECQSADGEPDTEMDGTAKEPIKAVDAFDITYTDLESTDITATVQAILSTMNANLMSEQTASGLMPWDLDYKQEQSLIDAEQTRRADAMLSGQRPMPPGIDPMTGMPGMPMMPADPNTAPDEMSGDEEKNAPADGSEDSEGGKPGPLVQSKLSSKIERY